MLDPKLIDFAATEPVSHDPGVVDREVDVSGIRWALVEYAPGAGRDEWCDTPHSGYVVSGTIAYSFEDGRDRLIVGTGEAFALPRTPRHRGVNEGAQPARLFLVDALPGV